jgi:Cu-Zn family superoxide dismutase
MTGQCASPDFASAGGHWNPTQRQHGLSNARGPHRGDLKNIDIELDGSGRLGATLRNARLSGGAHPLLDADGAALVVHVAADDHRTDPSGQSGARVACGVIRPS